MRSTGFTRRRIGGAALAGCLALAGCGGGGKDNALENAQGSNLLPQDVTHHGVTNYPAKTAGLGLNAQQQDLLTAGLGKTGLGAVAPPFSNGNQPSAAELRRNAIHSNYRGLLDHTSSGGYGRFYGPNIDAQGKDTRGEGLVPGKEYLGTIDDGSGRKRTVVIVQIPDSFNVESPCIVAGPSSGSRGVYGAIGTASEWGLKRGCAVALTDAGKGIGLYDPADDSVNLIDGTRATRTAAGALAHFAAQLSEDVRKAFNLAFPNRLALKHAHSQMNPEKDWGQDTLSAVRYALYALNEEYGQALPNGRKVARFRAHNTLVIAGSVSNGGAAVLRAAEQDSEGLIDGVVAGEPSAQPADASGIAIEAGRTSTAAIGKPLLDYVTYANIYQPCAVRAPEAAMLEPSFYNYMTITGMNPRAENRCAALKAKGLLGGASLAEQATEALKKLRDYGWFSAMDTLHNSHFGFGTQPIIATMYTNAYGRFGIEDNLCGMSIAQTNAIGNVVAVDAAAKAQNYANGNGTANGTPATPVYNDSPGGAKAWQWARSPSSGTEDFGLDAALCQRALVTGADPLTGRALSDTSTPTATQSQRVRAGMQEVLLNGQLRGKPTLIVHGRSDALIPVNHNSRAYAAYNRAVEGERSQLRYIEVTNAQHFDGFLSLSGFDNRFVPLHVYFNQAMDLMYANLTQGSPLPPSQVVHATPRGGVPGAAPPLTATHIPPITMTPEPDNMIEWSGSTLKVPD